MKVIRKTYEVSLDKLSILEGTLEKNGYKLKEDNGVFRGTFL